MGDEATEVLISSLYFLDTSTLDNRTVWYRKETDASIPEKTSNLVIELIFGSESTSCFCDSISLWLSRTSN